MHINLTEADSQQEQAPNKHNVFSFKRAFFVLFIFVAITGASLSYKISRTGTDNANSADGSILGSIFRLVGSGEKYLKGEKSDRTNFLLLGVGGAGHDGPELTDTIMFGSYRPSTNEIGLLSIPRDLTVLIPGYGYRKINHANAFGESERDGYGPELASKTIENILGQEVHYWAKVDFNGFESFIDEIGGINVYIERSFYDSQYPTDDYLTQTISFEQGWTQMNGKTALVYARSRHGSNGEGSDFARSKRQQNILTAVKDKVLSASVLLNPVKINSVIDVLRENIQTNASGWEILKIAKMARDIDMEKIAMQVLDESPDSPLYAANINGAYMLLPKNDDWSRVRSISANIFTSDEKNSQTDGVKNQPKFVRVEIQNGTAISGLAFQTSQMLQGQGFDVVKIGNATERGYDHTVIYDLTDGQKTDELKILQNFLMADVSVSAAGWVFMDEIIPKEITVTDEEAQAKTTEENIDFLVILGENSSHVASR